MMTRSAVGFAALSFGLIFSAFPGCGQSGIGDPCTPEQEFNADFNEFSVDQVSVESKSFQCQTRLCLVNHFQGRVSCPYGQTSTGGPANGPDACAVPGTGGPVTGTPSTTQGQPANATVDPQCVDRQANAAVYCSCRCQNVDGQTNDGAVYCSCPDGFACTQLVSSTGIGNEGLTGAYCVKNGTVYNPDVSPCGPGAATDECTPTTCPQ